MKNSTRGRRGRAARPPPDVPFQTSISPSRRVQTMSRGATEGDLLGQTHGAVLIYHKEEILTF